MIKRWSVEIPAEMVHLVAGAHLVQRALDGYTGTVRVRAPADFMRNTVRIGGEHDPTDAGSQAAVARLVALARSAEP